MAWITVQEAQRRLDGAVGLSTLYGLVKNGKLEATRIAGRVLIDEASLARLIADGRVLALTRRRKPDPRARRFRHISL